MSEREVVRRRRKISRKSSEERRLTVRGVWWIGVSLAMLAAGIVFVFGPLIEMGFLGIVGIAGAWYVAKWNLSGLSVARRMPGHVFAHRDFAMELSVSSRRKAFGHFGLEVEDQLMPRFVHRGLRSGYLGAGQSASVSLEARLLRRGRLRGETVGVRSAFPLGLVEAKKQFEVPSETVVFPRPVVPDAVHAVNDQESMDEGGEATYEMDRRGDFRSIREFRPGDSLKAIHWAASARTDQLMVREFDRPKPRRFSLVFHSFHEEGSVQWRENFDHALELLTGLLVHARALGIPVDLTASFFDWKRVQIQPRHRLPPVLTMIARARRRTETKADRLLKELEDLPGRHPVFVISESSLDKWHHLIPPMNRRLICLDTRRMRIDPIRSLLRWGDFVNKPNAA